ncbi:MAG: hypothetical protein LBV41_03070 [Cytophagaceae bacterium]|nr:hypothetical protein [Cytophagaceae bacterium]
METTLNPKDAEIAVSQLLKVVTSQLLEGKTVQPGNLGSFRLTASTVASDSEAEVTASRISKINVRFSESEDLKNMLRKATFMDTSSFAKKKAHNGNNNQNIKV